MTIANESNRTSVIGTGAEQIVPFTFPITNNSDIVVTSRVTATGGETVMAETTDYTVINNGAIGGSITTVTPFIASTLQIHIVRDTPNTQGTDLQTGGAFSADNVENMSDKVTKLTIENVDGLDRTLKFPTTDPADSFADMPNSVDRASKNLTFDSSGKPTASVSDITGAIAHSTIGTNIAGAANAEAERDLIGLGTADDVEFADITGSELIVSGPYIDARAHGLSEANSAADNATAIQAANDAANGKNVLIPVGTYAVTSVTINNCTLTGVGQEETILNVTGTITVTHTVGFGITGRLHKMTLQTATGYASTVLLLNGLINRQTMVLDQLRISSFGKEEVTPGSTGLLLDSVSTTAATVFIASSTFGSVIVEGFETGVDLNTNETGAGDAFINANFFQSLKIFNSTDLMKMTNAGTASMNNNIFSELFFQGNSGVTVSGLTTSGAVQRNRFVISIDGTYSGNEVELTNTSWFNTFLGFATIVDTAGKNTQINGQEIRISQVATSYGRKIIGRQTDQTTDKRYLLLAQKDADHSIQGTITGRLTKASSNGEYSARAYVNVLSDSSNNTSAYWEIDAQSVSGITLVELTYGVNTWIALDAVESSVSAAPFDLALFDGQYTEQTDQLLWVADGEISGLTAVTSSRSVSSGNVLNGSATYAGGAITDNSFTAQSVTVTGAALGDFAIASFSADIDDVQMNAVVTASNTVIVTFYNNTGGAKTPVGDVFVRVERK